MAEKKQSVTLAELLIQKMDTESYRAGKLTGWKHPKITRKEINAVGGQRALMEQARELEREGLIRVQDRDMGYDVEKIEFPVEAVEKLCRREGVEDPRKRQLRRLEEMRGWKAGAEVIPWLVPYYEELIGKLEAGKAVKSAEDPDQFRCLNRMAKLKKPVWERVFSCMVFGESKRFRSGGYREKLLTVLKKDLPECPFYEEGMTDDELLTACGILGYAQTLEWKGPLRYRIAVRESGAGENEPEENGPAGDKKTGFHEYIEIDTSGLRFGCVLNAQTLDHASPVGFPGSVHTVMTVENKANYENMPYREDTLYIYCHGFFSPKELRFLSGLPGLLPAETRYLHWGDMDYGGIRIFRFIEKNLFPGLAPWRMGAEAFEDALRLGAGVPLEADTRKKLEALDAGKLEDLKRAILRAGQVIEQEMLLALSEET